MREGVLYALLFPFVVLGFLACAAWSGLAVGWAGYLYLSVKFLERGRK